MSSDPSTRGQRRKLQTRDALQRAARELITERGVSGLRIQELTERADVALGSFYNHFESKEALVEAIVSESLEALADALATPAEGEDPAELVGAAIRRFVGLAYEDADFARLVVHLNHADAMFATSVAPAAQRAVDLGVQAGRFDVDDSTIAVTGIVGGALALMRGVVDGRIGPGADQGHAELALRALGVAPQDAAEIVRRPLPPVLVRE